MSERDRRPERASANLPEDPAELGDVAELRRQAAMHRRSVQRKAAGSTAPRTATRVPQGGGDALSTEQRATLESKLGADLSAVRVHTGGESNQAAEGFRARAFTVGNDIHFRQGEFAPGTREGDRLLAHELTHVVQGQGAGVQRKGQPTAERAVSQPNDAAEVEADGIADTIVAQVHDGGEHSVAAPRSRAATRPIQRKAVKDPIVGEKVDGKAAEEPELEGMPDAGGGGGADEKAEKGGGADAKGGGAEAKGGDAEKGGEAGAEPEPGGGDAKDDSSKLSDEDRWKKIEEFLAGSATGAKALELQKKYNIVIKWQKGGGSYWDGTQMVLDTSRPTERVALAFVHEMNHARYSKEGLGAESKDKNVSSMGREEYVAAMLNEEVEGTCLSIEAKLELEAKGQKVSVGYPLEDEYRAAYEKATGKKLGVDDKPVGGDTKAGGDKGGAAGGDKKPDDKSGDAAAAKKNADLDPGGKTAGRESVLKGFQDGAVLTSNTNEKYPEYYGKEWDKNNKSKAKK